MFFAGNRSHAIPLFVPANVLPLNMLYFETECSLMHDTLCLSLLMSYARRHIYQFCASVIFLLVHQTFMLITLDFLVPVILYVNKSRLTIQLNSFSIFGAKLWNCLKPELRKLRKKPFKNKIHQVLLAVLGNEDDYVDVSTLTLKITNYH